MKTSLAAGALVVLALTTQVPTHGKLVLIICVGPRLTSMCPRAFFST